MKKTHDTLMAAIMLMAMLTVGNTAWAESPTPAGPKPEAAITTIMTPHTGIPANLEELRADGNVPDSPEAPPFTGLTTALSSAHAPMGPNPSLELPSMTTLIQPADPDYNQWRAAMDAARAKRRRGMILTFGGLLGGPLVGGVVAGGSAAAGSETGIGVGALISLAGLGTGVWGIFQWINGHSEMGDLELDGTRAGYVSVSPIPGGAIGTVALSF